MGNKPRWLPPADHASAIAPVVSWWTAGDPGPKTIGTKTPVSHGRITVELTATTVRSAYLLRPSRRLSEITIGVLARAQKASGAQVHAFCYLSTHVHLIASFDDVERMARFMWYLQGNLAREICALTDWKDRVWARPYSHTVLSQEPSVLAQRLRYVCEQGVKEGLVRSPLEWPGASSAATLARGRRTMHGIWIDRADFTRAKRIRGQEGISEDRFTVSETLRLSPLPGFEQDWDGYVDFVRAKIESIEQDAEERHRAAGTRPLGVQAVKEVHPHFIPEHKRDRSPAPLAFASTKQLVKVFRDAYATIVAAYRAAAQRLRLGELGVAFPEGTFPPPRPIRLVPATG